MLKKVGLLGAYDCTEQIYLGALHGLADELEQAFNEDLLPSSQLSHHGQIRPGTSPRRRTTPRPFSAVLEPALHELVERPPFRRGGPPNITS